MTTLRSKLIRLAHAKPELRPHLLPLLAQKQASHLVKRLKFSQLPPVFKALGRLFPKAKLTRDVDVVMVEGRPTYHLRSAPGQLTGMAYLDLSNGRVTKKDIAELRGTFPVPPGFAVMAAEEHGYTNDDTGVWESDNNGFYDFDIWLNPEDYISLFGEPKVPLYLSDL